MKTTVQNVWLKKAGALVACSVFLGSPTAALANGGWGNLPVASSIPVGHFPTAPTQHHVVQSGAPTSAWGSPSGGTTGKNGHLSLKGLLFPANHSLSNAGSQANLWHGQQFLSSLPHTGNTNSAQSLFAGNSAAGVSGPGLQLDLTSTSASIVLGTSIFQGKSSVTIDLGSTREVFSAGAQVTPAEYVAIRQVLGGAHQTLSLSSQGAAVGGSFSLNAVSSAQITELVVPTGVTAIDYASKGNSLGIAGDVLNYGTIDGVAGRGQGSTVSLNAQDIINESGGLISTKLSSTLASSLGGVLSPVNLSLSAVDNISNSGNIVSSGSLSLVTTNGSISNGTVASGTISPGSSGGTIGTGSGAVAPPTIQAVHDVSLSTGSGNLINSGQITSSAGNININTANVTNDINISASGGTFQALKGDINVRDASYSGSNNINLNGGNYLTTNLNLYSGTGTIDGSVGQETGTLNTTAGADHLQVATANFLLGDNNVSGDPTFVNSTGSIQIVGVNQFGEDVAIIASGDITSSAAGQIVDHGHNITLVAGADITNNPLDDFGTVTGNTGSSPYPNSAHNPVMISASSGSVTGGSINLANAGNVIDTSSTTGSAGNVTLVAYGNGASQSFGGLVTLANASTINASGGGNGNGGNVSIIAPGGIQVGAINTGGGIIGGVTTSGGSISLSTTTVATSDNNSITFGAVGPTAGAITSGNTFSTTNGTLNNFSTIQAGGDLVTAPVGQSGVPAGTQGANAGSITIVAGSAISTQNLLAFGGGGAGGDSSNPNGGGGGNGGTISVSSATGNITVNGQVNASGGGGGGAGTNGAGGTGGAGGKAGSISITAVTADAGVVLLQTTGGVFAADGGAGGTSTGTGVGGGGGSYGGGGGGGSSGTTGSPGTIGGAGGAGYFGGGGADVDGAGGGGGYSGGSAGGSATTATAGTASTGGNGPVPASGTAPAGGQLSGTQGGQGTDVGAGTGGGNGSNIPTASANGNTVTLSSAGLTTIGGDIAGQNVIITAAGLTFQGNVFGTHSVAINNTSGSITQAAAGVMIMTPSLTLTLNGAFAANTNIGSSSVPLSTSAQTIIVTGNSSGIWIFDPALSTTFNWSGASITPTPLSIVMNTTNAALNIASLPTTLSALTLSVGSIATTFGALPTNGSINFENNSIALASGGTLTLTTNNLTWTNPGSNPFSITANNSAGSGGTISITTNQVNSSSAIAIGSLYGQFSLSATAAAGTTSTSGGSISLIAPTANLTVDTTCLLVGYSDSSILGNGGTILLNVATIANVNPGASLVLNASAASAGSGGTGNGGTVTVTTNTASNQTIGVNSGEINLVATNGGTASGTTQIGGKVSFINLGAGALIIDQSDPSVLSVASPAAGLTVNGGQITLTSSSITNVTPGSPLSLNVDGTGSGIGGKIYFTETNPITALNPTGLVTVGGPTGLALSAQGGPTGGNGGSILFSTNGPLSITTAANGDAVGSGNGLGIAIGPQSTTGNIGSLTLSATSFSAVTSAGTAATTPLIFNVQGQGSGSGGFVKITQLFDSTNPTETGVSLTIGTAVGDMEFIATNGATGPKGGTVIVTIDNNTTNNGLGTLTVDPSAISEVSSKADPNVSGGFIALEAPIIVAAVSTAPLVLNASGVGIGNGGAVSFEESNANSNPTIGTKPGQFELLAAAGPGGGSGGENVATSGGNLTVNPAALSVKATGSDGNGGFLVLSALNLGNVAGEGNALVTGALSVNGSGKGTGGTIGLNSNSSTAFNIGLTHNNTNGVEGGLSLTGGNGGQLNISISGSGGLVIQTPLTSPQYVVINANNASGNVDINSALGGTKTSQITITSSANQATGQVDINSAVGGAATSEIAIDAPNTSIIGGALGKLITNTSVITPGFISLTALGDISGLTTSTNGVTTTKQLQMVTTELTANAGGDIDINDANSLNSTLIVNGMNAGDSINLSSSGSISTLNGMNAATSINLSCGGFLTTGGVDNNIIDFAAAKGVANSANIRGTTSSGLAVPATDGDDEPTPISSPTEDIFDHEGGSSHASPYFDLATSDVNIIMGVGGNVVAAGIFDSFATHSNAVNHDSAPNVSLPSTTFGSYSILTEASGLVSLIGNTGMVLSGTFGNSTSTVSIQSTAAGASITGTALLSGKSVSVQTTGGDIGASGAGNGIQVNTSNVSATTGGAGNVYINNQGKTTLNVTASTAASFTIGTAGGANISNLTSISGDIDLTTHGVSTVTGISSSGNINISNTVGVLNLSNSTASNNVTTTSTGGANISGLTATLGTVDIATTSNIVISGAVTSNSSITLQTGTTGSITSLATSDVLSCQTVTLTSGSAGIGTSAIGKAVQVDTTNLVADSAKGAAYVNSTGIGNLSLDGANTTSSTGLHLMAVGDVTINGSVGGSTLAGVSITSGGANGILNGIGTITGNAVTLTATGGSIDGAGGTALNLSATTLTANASTATGGLVNINDSSTKPVTLKASSANGTGNFTVVTGGNLIIGGAIEGGSQTLLQSGTSGNITSSATTDIITATAVTLTGGSLGLGSSTQPIQVNTGFLLANAGPAVTGAVYVNSTGNTIDFVGSNSIKDVTLTAVGDISIGGTVGTNTASINIIAKDNGNIIANGGTLNGATVVLTSDNGTIGEGTALTVNTASLTSTAKGLVSIADTSTGAMTLNNSSGTSFSLTTNGPTTVHNILASGLGGSAGDITVMDTSISVSSLQTAASANISAINGAILLQNSNSSGTLTISKSNTIATSGTDGGNVSIVVGAVPTPPISAGTAPSNVKTSTSGTGAIYFGTNGITANAAVNTLTAKNASLIFSTGTAADTAILLSGGDRITADPPSSGTLLTTEGNGASSPGFGLVAASQSDKQQTGALNVNIAPTSGASFSSAINLALAGTSGSLAMAAVTPAQNPCVTTSTFSINGSQLQATGLAILALEIEGIGAIPDNATISLQQDHDPDAKWISETELESGVIPAVLSSDDDLGIHPNVSTILEMIDNEGALFTAETPPRRVTVGVGRSPSASRRLSTSSDIPLAGGISYLNDSKVKHISLTKGSVVFAPTRTTVVETPFGTVNLAAKSLTLVLAMSDGVAVYDFDDKHNEAVTVVAGDKSFVLAPGRHVLISKNVGKGFEYLNAAQLFAYRGIRQQAVGAGHDGTSLDAFTAEFNLLQAIHIVMPLNRLVSCQNPKARTIAERLLKTTAVLAELGSTGDHYNHVLRPTMVASK